jgi:uncharacterized membrane protein
MDFIREYFIDPIYQGTGYNTANTIVYGLLLGVGIMAGEWLVARLRIRVDRDFLLGILPYLVLASVLRSLVDAEIFPRSAWIITPGLFFTIFSFACGAMAIGLILQKKTGLGYHKPMGLIGVAALMYPAYQALTNLYALAPLIYIVPLFIISSAVFYLLGNMMDIREPLARAVIIGHMLDASATVVGVEYLGYFEEHVFENWIIGVVGTAYVIFPAKAVALAIVFYAIRNWVVARDFWYFAFFVLGFSPGLRDTLTILLLG